MKHSIHIARTAIGVLGNITSFFLFFSPAPTFWRIWKNKSVEEFHPYPYLAAVMNCIFWVFYAVPAVHPDSTLVATINSIGLALELSYLVIFSYYCDKRSRVRVLGIISVELLFAAAVMIVTLLAFHTHEKRSMFVGIICVIFGIILYASPLSIMLKVIKTKSVEFLPFWICVAGFANGIVWAIYALLEFDPYILTGNGVGALLGLSQLTLYAIYRKKKGSDDEKPGKPSEVQLQNRTAAV